jgi:hypothetical protein
MDVRTVWDNMFRESDNILFLDIVFKNFTFMLNIDRYCN